MKAYLTALLFASPLLGTPVFTDSFDGPSVDSALWQTILPYPASAVTQAGGIVTLTERGMLFSQQGFSGSLAISGTFRLNDHYEHFKVAARSDGLVPSGNGYSERTGIVFTFSNDGDQISIQRFESNGVIEIMAVKPYELTTGQTYSFLASLSGNQLSLAVNGIAELTAISNYSSGDRIGIFGRIGFNTSSSVDSITVENVPDLMSPAWSIVSLVGVVFCGRRIRRF